MDDLIRLSRKAANEWRSNDAYYQASVLIDSLCDRLEDAVRVVRCGKCKHWEEPYCMLCKTRIGASYHSKDMAYRKPDDFCSYGEQKEAEGNAD